MKMSWAAALLVAQWSLAGALPGRAAAADLRTLAEICGRTLGENTIVEVQGGGRASFGDCAIVLEGARLRILEAALDGDRLRITGVGEANLDIVGARIRGALEVAGSFRRILVSSSLLRGADAEIGAARGQVVIRSSTVRDGDARIATGDGRIRVLRAKFFDRSFFDARFGGIDVRFSDFRDPVEAVALGTGDLAFLSNGVRGGAAFIGDQRVVVAGNTFAAKRTGLGRLELEGDIVLANNLSELEATLRPAASLIVIANTFDGGRPSVAGAPASCIIEDNVPPVRCPQTGP